MSDWQQIQRKQRILVDNKSIEFIQDYTYLEKIIAPKDQTSKEIEKGVCISWQKNFVTKKNHVEYGILLK